MIIEIEKFIHPKETALVGPKNGASLISKLSDQNIHFADLEKEGKSMSIVIPDRIVSMNKSYFLVAWGESVATLGEKKFNDLYDFKTSPHIKEKIQRHVKAALVDATQEEILNV